MKRPPQYIWDLGFLLGSYRNPKYTEGVFLFIQYLLDQSELSVDKTCQILRRIVPCLPTTPYQTLPIKAKQVRFP
jgi:hypothetical protein